MATINGTNGNDSNLNGTESADISIFGLGGNDYIHGNGGDDIIDAGTGNDTVFGDDGNDTILGRNGADDLHGGEGNDVIWAEAGNDTLTGVLSSEWNAGQGEIDFLIGGSGADQFVLGDSFEAYYDDDSSFGLGTEDYAQITDFNPLEDQIVLHGSSSEYVIGDSGISGVSGLGIYYKTSSFEFELVGVLEDVAFSDVSLTNSSQFVYV